MVPMQSLVALTRNLTMAIQAACSYSLRRFMPEIKLLPVRVPERLPSPLTSNERRDLEQAERKIAAGLRSFLEVGMALKQIRDRKLFRQDFRSFEEYCAKRWDFTRQRGYELVGASEVMTDLSTTVDIRLLPANEAQARPLTVLRAAAHRCKTRGVLLLDFRDAQPARRRRVLRPLRGHGCRDQSVQAVAGGEIFNEAAAQE